jgi:hypothetical protein
MEKKKEEKYKKKNNTEATTNVRIKQRESGIFFSEEEKIKKIEREIIRKRQRSQKEKDQKNK